MVDFVLQEFGEIAVVSRFDFKGFAFETLIADRDLAVAFDLHEDREKTQASVPDDNFFLARSMISGLINGQGSCAGSLRKMTRCNSPSWGAAMPRP